MLLELEGDTCLHAGLLHNCKVKVDAMRLQKTRSPVYGTVHDAATLELCGRACVAAAGTSVPAEAAAAEAAAAAAEAAAAAAELRDTEQSLLPLMQSQALT